MVRIIGLNVRGKKRKVDGYAGVIPLTIALFGVSLALLSQGCGGTSSHFGSAPSTSLSLTPIKAVDGTIAPLSRQIVPKGGASQTLTVTADQGFSFAN